MKKAARVVTKIFLGLDYVVMAVCFIAAIALFMDIGNITGEAANNVVSASSGGAAGSTTTAGEAAGRAVGATVAGMLVLLGSFWLGAIGVYMIFPIVVLHHALKKQRMATCQKDMIMTSVLAIIALQILPGILLLAVKDEEYAPIETQ